MHPWTYNVHPWIYHNIHPWIYNIRTSVDILCLILHHHVISCDDDSQLSHGVM